MASAKATFAILLAVATIGVEAAKEIPEFLHICQTKELHYEKCVGNSIEHLKPYLKTGVPEYNIPSLEPLKIKKLTIAPTNTLLLQAFDMDVYGASNFSMKKVKLDLDSLLFLVDVALPNILVEGKYEVDGRILLLPIHGSGSLYGNFTNCIGACKIQVAKFLDKNGEEKIRIVDFRMKVSVGGGTLKLNNLFGGEQALGDVINSAINNNFDLVMKEFLPFVEKGLSDAFQNIADNILQQFTFAQLFPGA